MSFQVTNIETGAVELETTKLRAAQTTALLSDGIIIMVLPNGKTHSLPSLSGR